MRESVRAVLSRLAGASVEPDGALLARFAAERDEPAFAELVHRHGPMVLGVARRALGNGGDAEDVFQATFLLLAAKCRSIPSTASLAAWLHGVARRTAANARKATARRTARERARSTPTGAPSPEAGASLRELQAILDDELARLPEVYRAAFLLCHIEGHSRSEAAQLLGCSEGTVSSRVARARELLQVAIRRRGLELTAILTALAMADAACAAVSPTLAASTLCVAGLLAANGSVTGAVSPAVAALLRGGTGLKPVTVLVWVAVTTCAIAVGFAQLGLGGEVPPVPPQLPSVAQPARAEGAAGLEGTWRLKLPMGFEYEVRLERLADRYYRLHSHTVFGGLYKRDGDQLVLQTPTRGADPQLRWTLDGDASAKLTAEAEVFGARYIGATLTRAERAPPRESIDLGKHLLKVSMEIANGEQRGGIFMVPDTRDVAPADLFAQAQSGKIKPGFVELIARTQGPRSASDRLEVISFEEKDRKITATVKHVSVPDQQDANTVFYLRAKLAPLPPGKYDVEIRFEEWVKSGDEVRLARKPQFAPLTSSFTFPAPPKHGQ